MTSIKLTGTSISLSDVARVAKGQGEVLLCPNGLTRMEKSRALVDHVIENSIPVYGVTTGLGARANEALDAETLKKFSLQTLRGRAHSIGKNSSRENVRAAMIVRLNSMLSGYSGARPEVALHFADCLNANLTPVVGEIGSIGAGDLTLNAMLGLALVGEGEMISPVGDICASGDLMRDHGITPLQLAPRDGLAIANNTSAVAGAAAITLTNARLALEAAQTSAALSIEGFRANLGPFSEKALEAKPLPGQQKAAQGLRKILEGSELFNNGQARRLQDPLSIRNIAQIHGTMFAAMEMAETTALCEVNGASDNPVALIETNEIISCGGYFTSELTNAIECVSRAFVHLSMAQIARISKLLNPVFSDLPAFLAKPESGSNGFAPIMKPAEAVLAELLHAAQPVSIWPSLNANGVEDCLSSAPAAVRALENVVSLSANLTAIEFIVAAQAIELRACQSSMGAHLSNSLSQIRNLSMPLVEDRPLSSDIRLLSDAIMQGKF
ncbi:aromatic amino acid ammonia-lyase [Cochlodiniinecator piscidefendens]|uniref:aromatic amino acid ammonia-lyase n=1 Tax=Cochlodiniinecator piscidefendens TaxID=2715756 RepID=UPI00140D1C5E|nr:aromatic amino acid ammonia-lyase [Cochlodiniinecator piscidefendens]